MTPRMRMHRDEEDTWRIREFLREVFLLNGRQQSSWPVARWDYWILHAITNTHEFETLDDVVRIWEAADGRIAAVLNPEDQGSAYLQVHPAHRTPELEAEMIAVAEEHLAVEADGGRRLRVWAHADDDLRLGLVAKRDYVKGDEIEHQHRGWLEGPTLPDAPVPPGYTIRPMALGEARARAYATWRGFHADAPRSEFGGWHWVENAVMAPLYRRDLDLVAVAPDGSIVSTCTLWYDDVTRMGYYEPISTVREHRRLGLARATMTEARRRIRRLGAVVVAVSGFSPAANALYDQVVGPEVRLYAPWEKAW